MNELLIHTTLGINAMAFIHQHFTKVGKIVLVVHDTPNSSKGYPPNVLASYRCRIKACIQIPVALQLFKILYQYLF